MNDKEAIKSHIERQKNGRLLSAIARIESGYDNSAVGLAGEVGVFQIMGITVQDYNQQTNNSIRQSDIQTDWTLGLIIASWLVNIRIPELLKHYGHQVNLRNVIYAYNAGIGNVGKTNSTTEAYLNKLKDLGITENYFSRTKYGCLLVGLVLVLVPVVLKMYI